MKRNAIARIILFSVALLILGGILITGLLFNEFAFQDSIGPEMLLSQSVNTSDPEIVAQFHTSEITDIEIEWVSGNIKIVGGATDNQVIISESAVDNEKYKMVCTRQGSELKIEFCQSKNTFGLNVPFSKDLIIEVPRAWLCQSIDIDTASSDIYFNDFKIWELDINNASGKCEFLYCAVVDMDIDTASGDIFFDGELVELELDAASANAEFIISGIPESINANMASGDLILVLPDDTSLKCDIDVVSGEYNNHYPSSHHYDLQCHIRISALSGDVTIMPHCKYTGHH